MKYDVVLVGAGLANSLLALRLLRERPSSRLLMVSKGGRVGGNHTWSFHDTDLGPESREWVLPLASQSWTRQSVQFPSYTRSFECGYHSVTSEKMAEAIEAQSNIHLLMDSEVTKVTSREITVDGGWISAPCVVDGRGWSGFNVKSVGFQKFVGLDLEMESPHGLDAPVVMDATIEQKDGYRFFYLLPWDSHRLLVEDTRYSNGGEVDVPHFREEIFQYCEKRGWKVAKELRQEVGSLPIPMSDSFGQSQPLPGVPTVGARGGFFQPTTGYSFPTGIAVAEALAAQENWTSEAFVSALQVYGLTHQKRYFHLLNRLMFLGASPEQRRNIFEKFYRLPTGTVQRFYSGRLTRMDRFRILWGKPPISILSAAKSAWRRSQSNEENMHGRNGPKGLAYRQGA